MLSKQPVPAGTNARKRSALCEKRLEHRVRQSERDDKSKANQKRKKIALQLYAPIFLHDSDEALYCDKHTKAFLRWYIHNNTCDHNDLKL